MSCLLNHRSGYMQQCDNIMYYLFVTLLLFAIVIIDDDGFSGLFATAFCFFFLPGLIIIIGVCSTSGCMMQFFIIIIITIVPYSRGPIIYSHTNAKGAAGKNLAPPSSRSSHPPLNPVRRCREWFCRSPRTQSKLSAGRRCACCVRPAVMYTVYIALWNFVCRV